MRVTQAVQADSFVDGIADILRDAYAGCPVEPVSRLVGQPGQELAYKIQEANTVAWLQEGRRLVGRKIGLTSQAVQKQLGVDSPDFGMLFEDMEVPDGGVVASGRLIQPKIEAEIAFVMGGDLDMERPTVAELMRCIDFAVVALEIVDSRIANWNISLFDTIADNASSGLFVLGTTPRRLGDVDLRRCNMQMLLGETLVSEGRGEACLGNPLSAALWLARRMASVGQPLREGDVVLSGALGPMVAAAGGDRFVADVEGFGSVAVEFGRGE